MPSTCHVGEVRFGRSSSVLLAKFLQKECDLLSFVMAIGRPTKAVEFTDEKRNFMCRGAWRRRFVESRLG